MTDFITRLIGRTMGLEPTLQPLISPMFSPGFMIPANYSVLQSESIASREEADIGGDFDADSDSDGNKFDITPTQLLAADVNINPKISTSENLPLSNTSFKDSAQKSTLIENQNQFLKKVDASSDDLAISEAQSVAADVNLNPEILTSEAQLVAADVNLNPKISTLIENQNQFLKKVDASSDDLAVNSQSVAADVNLNPEILTSKAQSVAADVNLNPEISTSEAQLVAADVNLNPQKSTLIENQNQFLKKVDASSDDLAVSEAQSVAADVNINPKISKSENLPLSNTSFKDSPQKSTLIENQNQFLVNLDASSDDSAVSEAKSVAADVNLNPQKSTSENLSLPNTSFKDSAQKSTLIENQNQFLKKVDASSDDLAVSEAKSVAADVNINPKISKSENLSLGNTSFKDSAQKSTLIQHKLTPPPSLNNESDAADEGKFLQEQITINQNQPDNTSTSQELVKPLKTFPEKSLPAVSNRNFEEVESRNVKNKVLPKLDEGEISKKSVIMAPVRMLNSSTLKPQFQTNSQQSTTNSNLIQNPKSIIEKTDNSTNDLDISTTGSNRNKQNFVNPTREDFTSLISPLNNNRESQTVIEANNKLQPNPASNQIPRRVETATPPTIQITIGKIEVSRQSPKTSTPKPKSPARKTPRLSLNDYLKQRNGG